MELFLEAAGPTEMGNLRHIRSEQAAREELTMWSGTIRMRFRQLCLKQMGRGSTPRSLSYLTRALRTYQRATGNVVAAGILTGCWTPDRCQDAMQVAYPLPRLKMR